MARRPLAALPVPPMTPDWAPGLHPLVVHFPIALLVVAALADALALAARLANTRAARGLHAAAVGLFALGAVAAVAAYRTGNAASETVSVPVDALGLLNAHADAAWGLVWAAALFALVRVGVFALAPRAPRWGEAPALHAALALVGVAGLALLYQTAERGGELVYRHGIGVAAVAGAPAATPAPSADVVPDSAGAWAWVPASGDLPPTARVLVGTAESLSLTPTAAGLALAPPVPVLFTLGPPAGDLTASVDLDLSGFAGAVRLVHHVRDAQTYDFVAVERAAATPAATPTTVRLGRVVGGAETTFDTVTSAQPGRLTLSLSAVGTHFRGWAGDGPQTHGHDDAALAGTVGLSLDGSGPAIVHALTVTPVATDA